MPLRRLLTLAVCLVLAGVLAASEGRQDPYFKIKVVDDATGRGVPLVELATVNNLRYVTDSNGIVAFREQGLMGQSVFFAVSSHGYEYPKDGFGYRGVTLKAEEGGSAEIKIHRVNVAERLYRITGEGIYADSVLVGEKVPIRHPLFDGGVLGQDLGLVTVYHGKLYWVFGDTSRASYTLGDFNAPSAVSLLPKDGGLDPEVGVNLDYLNVGEDGFVRGALPMPGEGGSWPLGLMVLKDKSGRERMFVPYQKMVPPENVRGFGLAEFDDSKNRYEKVAELAKDAPIKWGGRASLRQDAVGGHVYFGEAIPLERGPDDPDMVRDPSMYEAFTCLKPGNRLGKPELDRNPDGTLRWGWKKNAPPLGPKDEAAMVKSGLLKAGEGLHQFRDIETGESFLTQAGSVYWNAWRKRWVMIVSQVYGSSILGEIWYAEADTPLGPWVYARRIVTHDHYTFYCPSQIPQFDKDGGRIIFFEGTYSSAYCTPPPVPTPRYDYNQIMYKLDLADDRLNLPVPVYKLEGGKLSPGLPAGVSGLPPIAFFALDREKPGAVKVPGVEPACWGLPMDAKEVSGMTIPMPGTDEKPACLVWKDPLSVRLPAN